MTIYLMLRESLLIYGKLIINYYIYSNRRYNYDNVYSYMPPLIRVGSIIRLPNRHLFITTHMFRVLVECPLLINLLYCRDRFSLLWIIIIIIGTIHSIHIHIISIVYLLLLLLLLLL